MRQMMMLTQATMQKMLAETKIHLLTLEEMTQEETI
jgi:hypothetical protein